MEDTKKRLGRGLSALLGDVPAEGHAAPAADRDPRRLPIDALRPNPANPRRSFHDEPLDELTQSIRERGIMQPLLVRRVEDHFEIIAGERRWRAAQRAGLHEVPVLVRDVSSGEALELAIIENVQRTDLNAIEEAMGYQRLIEEFEHKQDALAKLIGKSRSHVANTLRLLNLPPSIRASVADGSLSAGHARALIGTKNPDAIAEEVIRNGLSVRATEALVSRLNRSEEEQAAKAAKKAKSATVDDANTRALVRRLSSRLGLDVNLAHNTDESGVLTIRYSSLDQLEQVCRMLGEE
ncbi:ParB/RepB/Spo0J family partition protein [Acuticoccus sp. M5D2P5]|uniref:ParB/RepB/Spo0J family partition protein n=1 Tax=Acuticoccus kalidii TaxID=2910977 RepID=UPI001F25D1D9|nr:ParB/RepB/Spo0J family partition protein [Acuticoccus kalidii]MCF3933987.1 ParB/RepB/Spo0J family partition protein [Acuticoccus kalidii]